MRPEAVAFRLGCIVLLFFSLGACDALGPDDKGGPGVLTLSLLSPNGDEGSAVLELIGGANLGTVSPVGGEVMYQHLGGSSRIVVIMDEPGVVRFQVRTEEVQEPPEEVTIIQVANGENELRGSLAGYSVEFSSETDSSKKGRGA